MSDPARALSGDELRGTTRFEVVGRLGVGGMGVVYDALDRERGVHVALKALHTPFAENILRLKTEFRALRDLEHPNLLRLGELFEDGGQWFFTMDRIEGCDFLAYVRSRDAGATGSDARQEISVAHAIEVLDRAAAAERQGAVQSRGSGGGVPAASSAQEGAPAFDEARLRGALEQLVLGLDTIHRAGMVHRDVKPANVIVEGGGRVVLLDFGVVAELGRETVDQAGSIVGTVAYMAPEQACGEAVDSSADWYAVGSMLYEALVGSPPFDGAMMEALGRKVAGELPPHPSLVVPGVGEELAALCMRLLAREPVERPDAAQILGALGVSDPAAMLASSRRRAAPFVGRKGEIAALREACTQSRAQAVQVFVEGVSGIGKSAMVAQALEAIAADAVDALFLRGRCHENETVPFNAFDGVVDDLSRALRHLADPGAIALPSVAALLRVFPSLASVEALASSAAQEAPSDLAPLELRQAAFDQLRALVAALARTRPVVAVLEDVHWADAEALALLHEWGRAPSPATLLIGTARPMPDGRPCPAVVAAQGDVRVVKLGALSERDARTLVLDLVAGGEGGPGGERDEADVETILAEASGHPMFLGELAAFSRKREGAARGAIHLDDALLARIGRMPRVAQRVLEVVATAGVPIREATLARVLDAPRAELAPQISVLRSAGFLRVAGTRQGSAIEPYHDRVREAVYGHLALDLRSALHRRLGVLLEKEGAPHEILLTHFERCGDAPRAVHHALAGAEFAAHGLAFERAASLYDYAVRSGLHDVERERALRAMMGEMFRRAGRPRDAAEAFASAAQTGTPDPDTAFDLHRRVTEQYLSGGYRKEGILASRAVLAQVGEAHPRWYFAIVFLVLFYMVRLRFARLAYAGRDPGAVTKKMRQRLDAYWSLTAGFIVIDFVRGGIFMSKGALLAIRAGDDLHVARAGCAAVIATGTYGDVVTSGRLRRVVQAAADRAETSAARFYVKLSDVGHAFLVQNDLKRTLEQCESARKEWAKIGHRGGWESDMIEQFQLWALVALGEIGRLVVEVDDGLRFARATGNRFRENMLRVVFPQAHMLRDAPEEGEADVRAAVSEWEYADGQFASPDYYALKSRCVLAAYADRPEQIAELEREWDRYDRSALNNIALIAMESSDLRATLALRAAIDAKIRGDAHAMSTHLRRGRRFVRQVQKSHLRFARGIGVRLDGCFTLLERGGEAARPLVEHAIDFCNVEGWSAQGAGLRFLLGRIIGGDEGAALVAEARAWVARLNAKDPERFLGMYALGAKVAALRE